MKIYNLQENTSPQIGNPPKAHTHSATPVDGTGIDMLTLSQCHSGLVLCQTGAATGTPDSFSQVFALEESDDNITFTAVSGKSATRTSAGISEIHFNPAELKRYLMVSVTTTIVNGSSPTVPGSAAFLFGSPHRAALS